MYGSPKLLPPKRVAEVQRLLRTSEKKAKTSVSLSGELLRAADLVAGAEGRSALVERAVRRYLKAVVRRNRHLHDLAAINAAAEQTNRESDDLLAIQAWPEQP
jgi:metal-responsive CopG/Arc/MetJ family transcriptional regulator